MTINAVLFDFDGTLVNTNELIIASYQHALDTAYAPGRYTREDIIRYIGRPLIESFEEIDPERSDELVKLYQKHNHAYHDELIEEYEGVAETIKELYRQNFTLAIVTTKRKHIAYRGIEEAGLLPYFSSIITFHDVEHVKPDPEPLQKAMKEINANPEETLMVGDSQYDILAGKNAGVKTAGVCWSIKGEDYLRSFKPDVMLNKMPDILDYLGVKTK